MTSTNLTDAVKILNGAIEVLWNGREDGYRQESGEEFACHAVAHAYALLQDENYVWDTYGRDFTAANNQSKEKA